MKQKQLQAILTARLDELWQAFRKGDVAAQKRLLAPDFKAISPTAPYGHARTLLVQVDDGYRIKRDLVRLIPLGQDAAILTYRVILEKKHPDIFPGRTLYVSTVWRKMDGQWRAVLTQETAPEPVSGGLSAPPNW